MELITAKIVASFTIFTLALISVIIPIKLLNRIYFEQKNTRQSVSKIISRLNCFSGGVFLATCLLDLLPESREAFEDALDEIPSLSYLKDFPITEVLVIIGILLILIIEQCTISCKTSKKTTVFKVDHSDGSESDSSEKDLFLPDEEQPSATTNGDNLETQSTFRSFALVLAISIHSIFDGLAIGLQPTSFLVVQIATAIAIHKTIFSFSLGVQFTRQNKTLSSTLKNLACFTLASPFGIVLGILFDTVAADVSGRIVITSLLQAIATGTLVYVTFFEVLPKEFSRRKDLVVKNMCLVLGVMVVIGTMFLSEE